MVNKDEYIFINFSQTARLRNDLLSVEWDVKPYTLTQSECRRCRWFAAAVAAAAAVVCGVRGVLCSYRYQLF